MFCKGTDGEVRSLLLFPKSRFGSSGGVAVLARSHLGLCSMKYGENMARSHEVEPGRVVEAYLLAAGGIGVLTVFARWVKAFVSEIK